MLKIYNYQKKAQKTYDKNTDHQEKKIIISFNKNNNIDRMRTIT